MRTIADLRKFVREAAALLARERDFSAFEIYCSSSEHRVARLNFTSDIPSRGVEEFKSLDADGFALRVVMRRDPHETGSRDRGRRSQPRRRSRNDPAGARGDRN